VIDGLWGLEFGHGAADDGPANTLSSPPGRRGPRRLRSDHRRLNLPNGRAGAHPLSPAGQHAATRRGRNRPLRASVSE
jgi:hypothetical protein